MSEKTRVISQRDYLILLGLCEIVKQRRDALADAESGLGGFLGEEDDFGSYGHATDAIWEKDPAAYLLDVLDITVAEPEGEA